MTDKVDEKLIFCAIFDKKVRILKFFIKTSSQKNFNQTVQQGSSISNDKNNTLLLKF